MITNPRVLIGIKRAIDILEMSILDHDECRAIAILRHILDDTDTLRDEHLEKGDLDDIEEPKTEGGFLAARGVLADTWDGEPAEVTIRRLRDAD